jgi:hypothetical protein
MALPTAPLTGQAAIDRAASRVGGSMSDSGLCLAFTRQCYEVPSYYYSAIDAWNAAVEQHPDDDFPPSAPVWFWSSSPYRHVAFHLGDGQFATTFNAEIRQLSLGAMIDTFGSVIGWAPDLNTYNLRPATQPLPPTPGPTPMEDDEMIRIFAPGRGFAVIGPGYYKPLTEEEYQQSEPLVTKTLEGSDRQFDIWRAIAHHGVASVPGPS